jgi:hypothetical protein
MSGSVVVDADPLPRFSAADRAARQAILMEIYDWTHGLGEARIAARALMGQRDSLRSDLGANADSLNARIARLSGEIDRAFNAVNGQRQPIEAWSGLPSVDQRALLSYALEDARKALAELTKLVGADIPAAYRAAGKTWSRAVRPVTAPKPSAKPH